MTKTTKRKSITKPDTFTARLSFYLSLGFLIPIFNMLLSIVSIALAIRALRLAYTSKQFGGKRYAYVALGLSGSTLIVSVIAMSIYTFRKLTCEVAPTLF